MIRIPSGTSLGLGPNATRDIFFVSLCWLGCAGTSAQVLPPAACQPRVAELRDAGGYQIERRPTAVNSASASHRNYQCEEWRCSAASARRRSPGDGVHHAGRALLRITGVVTRWSRKRAPTSGGLRAAGRQGVRCRCLLCQHLWPVTAVGGRSDTAGTYVTWSTTDRSEYVVAGARHCMARPAKEVRPSNEMRSNRERADDHP